MKKAALKNIINSSPKVTLQLGLRYFNMGGTTSTLKGNLAPKGPVNVVTQTEGGSSKLDPVHLSLKKSTYLLKLKTLANANTPTYDTVGQLSEGRSIISKQRVNSSLLVAGLSALGPNNLKNLTPTGIGGRFANLRGGPTYGSLGRVRYPSHTNPRAFQVIKNILSKYLTNSLNSINLIKDIGVKNGILFNYNKIVQYNFYNSTTNGPILRNKTCTLRSRKNTVAPTDAHLSSRVAVGGNLLTGSNPSLSLYPSVGPAPLGYFKSGTVSYNKDVKECYNLLYYFFKSIYCLISKPVFIHSPDKLTIQLFYYLNVPKKKVFKLFSILYFRSFKSLWNRKLTYGNTAHPKNNFTPSSKVREVRPQILSLKAVGRIPFIKWKVRKAISRLKSKTAYVRNLLFSLRKLNLIKIFSGRLSLLCEILSNKFNKPVELQLIRLHHPYHDSNILVNLLSLNIKNKRKKARIAINKIYNKRAVKKLNDPSLNSINSIPNFLSGLNVKIAGRLMREPIVPRMTTKIFGRGASSPGKVNYLDVATITKKNRKGAYTITIKSGQNFFPIGTSHSVARSA